MRMCDLNTGATRLKRTAKMLKDGWGEASEFWNDGSSRQFEESFLKAVGPTLQQVVGALYGLAEVLEEAEKECEENRGYL